MTDDVMMVLGIEKLRQVNLNCTPIAVFPGKIAWSLYLTFEFPVAGSASHCFKGDSQAEVWRQAAEVLVDGD